MEAQTSTEAITQLSNTTLTQPPTSESTTSQPTTAETRTTVVTTTVTVPTTTYAPESKYVMTFTTNLVIAEDLTNQQSAEYLAVASSVAKMVVDAFSSGNTNIKEFIVISMVKGSLKITGDLITKKDTNSAQTVAETVSKLQKGTLKMTYNGTRSVSAQGSNFEITLPDGTKQIVSNSTTDMACKLYEAQYPCGSDYRCAEDDKGQPKCIALERQDSFGLIVGLGVGIPLFFIAALIIAGVCIYQKKLKRRSKSLPDDFNRTHDHEGFFTGGITPKFGSWGQPPYYSPGGWDDDDSGSDETNGGRRKRRGDQFDAYQGKDFYVYDNGALSNFSWDFMYQYVDPSEQYKIKRPTPEYEPNPVYTSRKNQGTNA